MKIKWKKNGENGGQNGNGWDFALVKANENGSNDAAQQYCKNQGFTTPVEEDWSTVYKNLGWNVETKQETTGSKKETRICIWKISSEGSACGRAMSCFWEGLDN